MRFIIKIINAGFIKSSGIFLIRLIRLLFIVSTLSFIGYFVLEYLKVGIISNYFDLNYLLVLSISCGLLILLFDKPDKFSQSNRSHLFVLILFSLLSGLLCYQYLQNLEKMRYFIPPLVIISLFISLYLYLEKDYD